MASYLTYDEFMERAVQADVDAILSDLSESVAETYIDDLCAEASGELDGYAGGRYGTPLVITDQVRRIVFELAWFLMSKRRGHNWSESDQKEEKELRRKLERISDRKFHLIGQSHIATADNRTSVRETDPSARTTGRARKFTREKMEGF